MKEKGREGGGLSSPERETGDALTITNNFSKTKKEYLKKKNKRSTARGNTEARARKSFRDDEARRRREESTATQEPGGDVRVRGECAKPLVIRAGAFGAAPPTAPQYLVERKPEADEIQRAARA